MRKLLLPCVLLAGVSTQSALAVDCSVGVVNVQNAIAEMKATKAFNTDVEKKYGPTAKRLENMLNELKTMEDNLRKEQPTLKEADLRIKQNELQEKAIKYKGDLTKHQKDLQTAQQTYLDKISPDLQKALASLASKKKVSSIMNRNAAVYVQKECDYTAELTQELDKVVK